MHRFIALAAALSALVVGTSAEAAECGTPDRALDATWQNVAGGWLAGDAAFSAPLPGRHDLWLFGDSLIGRGTGIRVVRNAAVLRHPDGTMTTVAPTDGGDLPFAQLPAGSNSADWLWPGDMRWIDGKLWAFFAEMQRTGPGGWDFRFVASWLARVDPVTLRIRSLQRVGTGPGFIWGAATVVGPRYLYIFGIHEHGSEKHLHLARVLRSKGLTGTWTYWDRHRWRARPVLGTHVLTDVSNQISVLRINGAFVLITNDATLGSAVRSYRATRLAGPWRPLNVLYHAVPRTSTGITYATQAHPELAGPGLVLTYSVMENAAQVLPNDPANYRPRFFRVRWACIGGRRDPDPAPVNHAYATTTVAKTDAGTIPSRPFGESRVAADARGDAIAAWVQSPDPTRPRAAVFISQRPAGGPFGAPERASRPKQDARAIGLAVAPNGRAALAWRIAHARGANRLVVARGNARTGFGRGRVIARGLPDVGWSGATEHPGDPVVAVSSDGATLVSWLAPGRCGNVVRTRRIAPDGTLGATRTLSRGCPHATTLRGAVDRRGDGVVAWRAGQRCGYARPCHYSIQAAAVHRGVPHAAVTVSRHPAAALGLDVAAGGGRAVVTWRNAELVTRERTLGRVLAVVSAGGGFGAPVAISASDRIAGFPAAAAGPDGQLLVAWQALSGPGASVETAAASAGARFGPPVATGGTTSGFGYRTAPLASFDAAGRATVAWTTVDGGLRAAVAQPAGGWRTLAMTTGPSHAAALAGGAAGESIGLWTGVSELGQLQSLQWRLLR